MPSALVRPALRALVLSVLVSACSAGLQFPAPDQVSVAADTRVAVPIVAIDSAGAKAEIALVDPPAWATVAGKVVTLAPGRADVGTHAITLKATAGGDSAQATLSVTVTAGSNRAPTLAALEAQAVAEGSKLTVATGAVDPEGDVLTLSLVGPAFASLDGTDLVLAPTFDDAGAWNVVLQASDPAGATTFAKVAVTVTAADAAPVIAGPAAVDVTRYEVRLIPFRVSDPDGDDVTLTLGGSAPRYASLDPDTGIVTLTPDERDDAGSATLELVATANGATTRFTSTITLAEGNAAPTLRGLDTVNVLQGDVRTIPIVAVDRDGDALTFEVTGADFAQVSEAPALVLSVPDRAAIGTTTLTLTANDGHGGSASQAFELVIAALQTAPTTSALEQRSETDAIAPGATVTVAPTFSVTVADRQLDASTLEFELRADGRLRGEPTHRTSEPAAPGTITWTPADRLGAGAWAWQVRAVDATGLTGPWLAFAEGGTAFVIDPITLSGSLTIDQGAATNDRVLSLTIDATPAEGAALETIAFSSDGRSWTEPRPYATSATWLAEAGEGLRTVHARVTDSLGNTAEFSAATLLDTSPPVATLSVIAAVPEDATMPAVLTITSTRELAVALVAADPGDAVSSVCFSNDGLTFDADTCHDLPAFAANAPPLAFFPWEISDGEGLHVVSARVTDRAGNQAIATAAVALDTVPPEVSLSGLPVITSLRSLPVTVSVHDASPIDRLCWTRTPGDAPAECDSAQPTHTWLLAGADGEHLLTARAFDAAGNVGTAIASIVLDTVKPGVTTTFASLQPVDGAYYTNVPTVALTLAPANGAADLASMQFSPDGLAWGPWLDFATTASHQLTSGEGAHRIFTQVRDLAGNVSAPTSLAVTLDTVAPSGPVSPKAFVVNNDDSFVSTTTATLAFRNVTDATSGVYQVDFANEAATASAKEAFGETRAAWPLSANAGPKTVVARVYDRAGNFATFSDDVTYDPNQPTLTVTTAASAVRTTSIQVSVTVRYSGTAVTALCGRNDGGADVCNLPIPANGVATTVNWTLPAGDGAKTITFRADRGAAASASTTLVVVLDTTAPTVRGASVDGVQKGYATGAASSFRYSAAGPEASAITSACTTITAVGAPPPTCTTWTPVVPTGANGIQGTGPITPATGTMWLRLKDAAGNEGAIFSLGNVALDTAGPTGTYTINTSVTSSTRVTLTLTVTDAGAGLGDVTITQDNGNTRTQPYSGPSVPFELTGADGKVAVSVTVTDRLGNATALGQKVLILDRRAPVLSLARAVTDGQQIAGTGYDLASSGTRVDLTVRSDESPTSACFKVTQGPATAPAASDTCWAMLVGQKTLDLTAFSGLTTVTVFGRDDAGNLSVPLVWKVLLDRLPPTAPVIESLSSSHHALRVVVRAHTDAGVGLGEDSICLRYGSPQAPQSCVRWAASIPVPDGQELFVEVKASDLLGNSVLGPTATTQTLFPWKSVGGDALATALRSVASSPDALLTLAVGDYGLGVRLSHSGETIENVFDLGTDATGLDVAVTDSLQAAAITANQIFLTADGGISWHPQPVIAALGTLGELEAEGSGSYALGTSNGLWRFTVAGSPPAIATTTQLSTAALEASRHHVAVSRVGSPLIVTGYLTGVYVLAPGQASVKVATLPAEVLSIQHTVEGLYVAHVNGTPWIYTSAEGRTWRALQGPDLTSLMGRNPRSVNVMTSRRWLVAPYELIVACSGGVCTFAGLQLAAFDSTFVQRSAPTTASAAVVVGSDGSLVRFADPSYAQLSFRTPLPTLASVAAGTNVWLQAPNCETWVAPRPAVNPKALDPKVVRTIANAACSAIAEAGPNLAYSVGYDPAGPGFILSHDKAAGTTTIATTTGAQRPKAVACAKPNGKVFCMAVGDGLFFKVESGFWTRQNSPVTGVSVVIDNGALARVVVLSGFPNSGIYTAFQSLDGTPGAFERAVLPAGTGTPLALAVRGRTVVVATSNGLLRSTGAEFARVTSPALPMNMAASPVSSATATWAFTGPRGEFFVSTDDGLTWTQRLSPPFASQLVLSSDTEFWVAGYGVLSLSQSGGL